MPKGAPNNHSLLPSGISHSTIHRPVAKVTNPYLEAEEKEIEEVFEAGAIPESEGKVVPCLLIEADGTGIALQVGDARRDAAKAGIAYEGWQKVSEYRYRLEDKMRGDRFWEGLSLTLAKKYDLSHLKRALHRGLANEPLVVEVYQACITGKIDKADRLLIEAQEKADSDRAKEI